MRITEAVLFAVVVVDLGAGAARAGLSGRTPPVLALGEAEDLMFRHADAHPVFFCFQVFRGVFVTLEDRDPELLRRQTELLCKELPGPRGSFLFEVVSEREVPHHLEEREVARITDFFKVLGAETFLGGDGPGGWWLLLAGKVRYELLHTGGR